MTESDPNPPSFAAAPASTQIRAVLRVLVTVLAVLLALWLVYALAGVIALIILAVFFAYVLSPAVAVVQRVAPLRSQIWGRTAAVLVVYASLFGSLTIAVYALAPKFGEQAGELGSRLPGYVEASRAKVQDLTRTYRAYRLPPPLKEAFEASASRAFDVAGESLRAAVTTVLSWIAYLPWLILIPVLAFFFLKDADAFQKFALHLLPEGRIRWRGRDYIDEINHTLALYVRAQLIACVIIGFTCGVGFTVIGVPYALFLGVLAGLLEFVPLIGPVIVAVLAGFLASLHSLPLMGVTVLFLAILRLVQDYVIYPRLVASGMKLHPLAIILTLLCGSHLAGVAGLFLAIPAAAVLMVSYRFVLLQLGQETLLSALVPARPTEEPAPLRIKKTSRLGPSIEGELSGISVAIVDNDEDARTALVDALEISGATVYSASSAAEALSLVEANHPDVLLSDLAMPDQDGFDLIRSLRALPPGAGGDIRAAALSGYASEEDRSRTLAAGFQQHLSKPVDPVLLIATVRELARPGKPASVPGGAILTTT